MVRRWWFVLTLVAVAGLVAQSTGRLTVGRRDDGSGVTANGWLVTPVGTVIKAGEMPQNAVLSPDGRRLAVANCGFGTQSVMMIDTATAKVVQQASFSTPKAVFRGLAFSRDGQTLYVSGGPSDVLRVIPVAPAGGVTLDALEIPLRVGAGIPVVENPEAFAGRLKLPDPEGQGVVLYPGGVTLGPDGRTLWVTEVLGQTVVLVDPAAKPALRKRIPVGGNPYDVLFDAPAGRAYVSLWGGEKVAVLDTTREVGLKQIPVGKHPTGMCLDAARRRLYVANAHSDTVSIVDTASDAVVGSISLAPYPGAPLGTMPTDVKLSPDGGTLYVASAGNNAVEVVTLDAARTGGSVAGRLPTGWYPTSLQVAADGSLWVTSAKGLSTIANPTRRYIGSLLHGIVQHIAAPDAQTLAAGRNQVRANNAEAGGAVPRGDQPTGSPIPRRVGEPSPIKYCVYVIKENRTYDQVFGDLPQGNGEPKLAMFGRAVTPNQHRLAEQYVLLDNFYCDGEVSVDGHQWCKAASVADGSTRSWPASYSQRGPGLGGPLSRPATSWLWEQAAAKNVSAKVYQGGLSPGEDLKRVATVLSDVARCERAGGMPRLLLLHLPNNHTFGTAKGKPTPKAMVAENDLAVGRLVEGLSRSKFWPEMAVFMVEDDAQDGPDHVDCHRSPCLVLGPWVKRGVVDHGFHDQVSVLRTIELILGLDPLSQFDAAAMPMYTLFDAVPKVDTYDAVTPEQPLDQLNALDAYGQRWCDAQDFGEVDTQPWAEFNRILWHAVNGADTPMPPVKRTRFALAVDVE